MLLDAAEDNRLNGDEHYKITTENMGMFRPTTNLPRRIIIVPQTKTHSCLKEYFNTVKVTVKRVTLTEDITMCYKCTIKGEQQCVKHN